MDECMQFEVINLKFGESDDACRGYLAERSSKIVYIRTSYAVYDVQPYAYHEINDSTDHPSSSLHLLKCSCS